MDLSDRRLGKTEILVGGVAMGCWPIAGMTSLDVNDADSRATLHAAFEAGIRFFDTAYCYGAHGESERLIGSTLGSVRDELVIATKAGIHWDAEGRRVQDARPETILRQCNTSLERLGTDRVELLYLHAPDPQVPITETAAAFKQLLDERKTRSVGISNASVAQIQAFDSVCPISAVQPHYNMLQREIELDLVPYCLQNQISLCVYWPLMKGLLSGHLRRDHVFAAKDGRAKYPMFQGEEWQRNQDFVDRLRKIAAARNRSVTEIVVNWTIHRPGITSALCGAKRPEQIRESAAAMGWRLDDEALREIDQAIAQRGQILSRAAV